MYVFLPQKKYMNFYFRNILPFLLALVLFFPSVQIKAEGPFIPEKEITNAPPRIIRTCCSFGANIGYIGIPFAKKTDVTSPSKIGSHKFLGGKEEINGNIYTRRGGFIDLGHLRDCADWTAYLYELITAGRENKNLEFIDLGNEGGAKSLKLMLPENLSDDDAIVLAGKIAYDLSVWHEISTWFGASYVPLVPERFSSFSPEDLYSNLMGVHLAMGAIKSDLEYNDAMTQAISEMLVELEAVNTEEETFDTMLKVDRLWYTSEKRLPNKKVLIKRYLDSGSELIPWLVPEMESFLPPFILQKPSESLTNYYELSIKLNFKFPVKNIFPEQMDRVITEKDFDIFIDFIQNDLNKLQVKEEKHENRVNKRKENRGNEVNLN